MSDHMFIEGTHSAETRKKDTKYIYKYVKRMRSVMYVIKDGIFTCTIIFVRFKYLHHESSTFLLDRKLKLLN